MCRRFQFSVRALLVVMTAICVWLALVVERAQRQRKAVDAIQSAQGGTGVYYEVFAGQDLTASGCTKRGVAELEKHLPKCRIDM